MGIDPDLELLSLTNIKQADLFYKRLISTLAPYCSCYKPNLAFFEALGLDGLSWLKDLISYAKEFHPVILDAKRGDIGNTAKKQARFIFDVLGADATTLHPYMGSDSIFPFLDYEDKFSFVLVATSNPSAKEFEMQALKPHQVLSDCVYDEVLKWNQRYKNLGVVMGATNLDYMTKTRKRDSSLLYLVPGVGAQGGSYKDIKALAKNKEGSVLINVSRGLIPDDLNSDSAILDKLQLILSC